MITYLLKSGLLLAVFYAVYKLLLENERMFRFNRAYLLGSLIFSFIIPLQLFTFKPLFESGLNAIQLEGIEIRTSRAPIDENYILEYVFAILKRVYVIVAIVLGFRLILNVLSFFQKLRSKEALSVNGVKVILTDDAVLPHSFWNAIFVNKTEFETGRVPSELIVHEKAHLEQRHTLDILFIATVQTVFWFNPFISLFRKAIKLNHEFLADEAVNKQFGEVKNYQNLLLQFASNKKTVDLASNINYLITKKRLLMMTKEISPIAMILKISSVAAVCFLLLIAFNSEAVAQTSANLRNQNNKGINYVGANVGKPQFPGGIEKFYMFVGQNFRMSEEFSKQKIQGKFLIEFMVEKDGSLSDFKVVKDLGYGTAEEAIRVLKLSPKWIPATENGQAVRVMYSLPITLQSEK
ncbi:MAG: M56 family metallopeptidase [Flavobacterium nitrogenifigens]|uniref:Signal transducer regulating beta-lactamase production, contains metallopeptidase domain n=1 Tax=Flavobacterium nitrogenifigens TaxID=1617283 RepID=A0A521CFH9_9FLAO|nr:M56 family metallopeptidase [Flavobacterium nitrogenifigens]MDQ8011532.1 M56 family metallopeptidase [Flavobacterium nitrogenifigens]SMO58125.1 Signal transducer regulating beta-lactamase production, contains metallopeptidase domain [Flavobacterium nitrogenifigens]